MDGDGVCPERSSNLLSSANEKLTGVTQRCAESTG
jgi:hypothetical protein